MPNAFHNRRGFAASGAEGALLVTLLCGKCSLKAWRMKLKTCAWLVVVPPTFARIGSQDGGEFELANDEMPAPKYDSLPSHENFMRLLDMPIVSVQLPKAR